MPPLRNSSWDRAVPVGRVGYDLRAPSLLAHTFLDADGYEALARDGVLRADPDRAEPTFAEAYEWLRRRHEALVPGSAGGPLLWFWVRCRREELVRQARWAAVHAPVPQVLLTCRLPAGRVLVSDYSAWHSVLNRWPGWAWSDDDERMAAESDALVGRLDGGFPGWHGAGWDRWPAGLRAELERSWDRCLAPVVPPPPRGGSWQGVVEEVRAGEVVDAVLIETMT